MSLSEIVKLECSNVDYQAENKKNVLQNLASLLKRNRDLSFRTVNWKDWKTISVISISSQIWI